MLLFIYILGGRAYPSILSAERYHYFSRSHIIFYLYSRWERVSFSIVGGTTSLFLTFLLSVERHPYFSLSYCRWNDILISHFLIVGGTTSLFLTFSRCCFVYILGGSEYPSVLPAEQYHNFCRSHVVYLYARWERVSFSIVGGTISLFHDCEYVDYIQKTVELDKEGIVFFSSPTLPFQVSQAFLYRHSIQRQVLI